MKIFTLSFKSLLLAAGLIVGSANAWGEDVYTPIYTRATVSDWLDTDVEAWGNAANLSKSGDNGLGFDVNLYGTWQGISASKSFSVTDNAKVKYEFDWYFGSSLSNAGNYAFVRFGDFIIRWFNNGYSTSFSVDGGSNFTTFAAGCTSNSTWTKAVEVIIDTSTGDIEKFSFGGTDFTESVSGSSSGTFGNVSFGFIRGGRGGNWPVPCFLKTFKVSECEQEVETADYTINYIYNAVTKSTTAGNVAVGTTVNAVNPITISDVKYYAKAGETTSMVIAKGTNVLNVDLRLAETWNYTIRALDGSSNVLNGNLTSGSVTEGESTTIANPQYVLYGTTLYNITTAGDPWYRRSITPTTDDYVYDLIYNNGTVEDVVFYTEAEAVSGATAQDMTSRASNGQVGYTENANTYVDATTLSPGKYIIYMRTVTANSGTRTFNFKAGDVNVFSYSLNGNNTNNLQNSDEFTVYESSTLSFACNGGGGSGNGMDWFYVKKTGNVFTPKSSANLQGYKTFYNAGANYEVDANTTIYIATTPTSGAENVVLTPVSGKVVPANKPVILKTTNSAGEYVITLTQTTEDAEEPEEFDDNGLQVATASGAIDGAYILAYTTANGLGFYPYSSDLDAGDVYITVSGPAKKLSLVVGGEASEVVAPEVAETEEEEVLYNMAGIQVDKNFKGFVVNQKGVKRFNK